MTIPAAILPWLLTFGAVAWVLFTPPQNDWDFSIIYRLPAAGFIAAVGWAIYFAMR